MIGAVSMLVLRTGLAASLLLLAACGGTRVPPRGIETLPRDSLAMLRQAMRQVRPGFRTQREALLAGTYGGNFASDSVRTPATGASPGLPQPARSFVVQIAAYGDSASAEQARRLAERQFPGATGLIERAEAVYRVVLGAWDTQPAAEAELLRIRRRYPGAWVRRQPVP